MIGPIAPNSTGVTAVLAIRLALIGFAVCLVLGIAGTAGPRSGILIVIGLGYGLVLEGLRFGFAGPWRVMAAEL